MTDPFRVVHDFEAALAEYTGAPYAVTVSSCTTALFLALRWWEQQYGSQVVEVPARTYVSVPMVAMQAGHRVRFVDYDWHGYYRLSHTGVYDAAPMFQPGMYIPDKDLVPTGFVCVSFHPRKPLGLSTGGGAVLHDSAAFDEWARRMRFDGRTEGRAVADDAIRDVGYHAYMMPPAAAEGLQRLSVYRPGPMVQDTYPDLRTMPVFQSNPMIVEE